MSKAFENSCFKGCMIYFMVLGVLVVAGAVGLSSLGARLGLGAKPAQLNVTTLTTSQQGDLETQLRNQFSAGSGTSQPITVQVGTGIDAGTGGGSQPLVQATVVVTIQQPQITIPQLQQIQPQQAQSQPTANPQPAAQAPAQAAGVTGQATTPFYIVQGGDSLWSIATQFGTTVDSLKEANHLDSALIKPNQLLYLPSSQPPSQPPPPEPQSVAPLPDGSTDPVTGGLPSMPDTGINAHR